MGEKRRDSHTPFSAPTQTAFSSKGALSQDLTHPKRFINNKCWGFLKREELF